MTAAPVGVTATPVLARRQAALSAGAVLAGWSAALWVSAHVETDPVLHQVALFAHLACLIAGLGAVLTIDYVAAQWLLGRRRLADLLLVSATTPPLVWAGLVGLMTTGALLGPDLDNPATRAKLALVLLLALNGVQAAVVQRRLETAGDSPARSLLFRASATAVVSQVGWWGATLVGFLTTQAS